MTVQHNILTGARGIEWCCETRNPIGGCRHACRWRMPDGTIAKCYAEELAENGLAKAGYPHGFAHHYWRGDKGLRDLIAGQEPLLIFMDSMADLFGGWVPDDQVRAVLAAVALAPHHTYQSLTKAPKRLMKFADDMPPNLWVGVSSAPDFFMGRELTDEQKARYTRSAVTTLAEVKATTGNVTWMSLEPVSWDMAHLFEGHTLDWAIVGAASSGRRYFQPDARHIDRLLDVFDAVGTPIFYKGNIKPLFETWDFGSDAKNRWREDFPVRGGPAPAVLRRQRLARRYGWTLNTMLLDEVVEEPDFPAAPPATQPSLFAL